MAIITGNLRDLVDGERKANGSRPPQQMVGGVFILLVGMSTIGRGSVRQAG